MNDKTKVFTLFYYHIGLERAKSECMIHLVCVDADPDHVAADEDHDHGDQQHRHLHSHR